MYTVGTNACRAGLLWAEVVTGKYEQFLASATYRVFPGLVAEAITDKIGGLTIIT